MTSRSIDLLIDRSINQLVYLKVCIHLIHALSVHELLFISDTASHPILQPTPTILSMDRGAYARCNQPRPALRPQLRCNVRL